MYEEILNYKLRKIYDKKIYKYLIFVRSYMQFRILTLLLSIFGILVLTMFAAGADVYATTHDVGPIITISTSVHTSTNLSAIPFTIQFSEPVTGFAAGDITTTSGTIQGLLQLPSSDILSYTFTVVNPTDGATLTVSMAADAVQNADGNTNAASNTVSVSVDRTAPTVTGFVVDTTTLQLLPPMATFASGAEHVSRVVNSSTIRIILSEPIYGKDIAPSDFVISNVTIPTLVSKVDIINGTNSITLTLSVAISSSDSPYLTYTPTINRIIDLPGNPVGGFEFPLSYFPIITLGSSAANPTSANPIPFTITFSESVTGFTASDITASTGTVQNLSPPPSADSAKFYTFDVADAADGAVLSVIVPANRVQDEDGYTNAASNTVSVSVDRTAPTVTEASVIDTSTIRLVLSEPVSTNGIVTPGDFTITNVAGSNHAVTTVTITANTDTVTLTISPSISGADTALLVSYTPGTNRIADAAANQLASFDDRGVTNTLDLTTPTVTLSTTATDPTNAEPVPFTITFSEAVIGFTASDITATTGTVQNISPLPSQSATSYTFTVADAADGAVLSVSMSANTVQDTGDNANTASNTVSLSIDRTAPTVTEASVIDTSTIRLVLSEPVSTNGIVTPGDFTITNVAGSNPAVTQVTINDNTNTVTLTLSPLISGTDTAPLVSYTPGTNRIADAAANQLASFSNRGVTNTLDPTMPVVTIATDVTSPTNVELVPFTINFDESVTEFTAGDITATTGTVQNLSPPYSQSTTSYTFNVAGVADGATLSVSMPAGTVRDTDNNANAASNTVSLSIDRTAPTVTAAFVIDPSTIRLATSEPVFANNIATPNDFTITGVAGSNPAVTTVTITNNTSIITLILSAPVSGTDTAPLVSYAPRSTSHIADAAANQLASFSNENVTNTLDSTPLTVDLSTTATDPTNADPISFTVQFSKAVTGFDATDITHSSGTVQNFDSSHYLKRFRSPSRNNPFDVAINSTGYVHVLVASPLGTIINAYDSNDVKTSSYLLLGLPGTADGNLDSPQGMTIDSNDDIYIVDTGNDRIQKFSTNGTYIEKFGTAGTADGQFGAPNSIAINSIGHIYVTDSERDRVHIFDSDYSYLGQLGGVGEGTGDGEFNSPRGIAIDSDDNIYVTDFDNDRIQIFDKSGTYQRQFGVVVNGPIDIALDSNNNIYVSDYLNDLVHIFNNDGTYQRQIGGVANSDSLGEFNGPRGIAVDSDGDIYVADDLNERVQKLSPTPNRYTFDIDGSTDQETLTVSIAADVANNAATVGNSPSNVVSRYIDRTAPTVTSAAATSATSVELTVSESVSGTDITPSDFVITDVDSLPDVSTVVVSGTTITLTLSAPITDSDDAPLVSYTKGTKRITDAATNQLESFSNEDIITTTVDFTMPVVTIVTGSPTPTNADSIPFTINFSEPVKGFDTTDITVSSGTVQNISPPPSLSATSYTFNVAGAVDGDVLSVSMSAGTVQDTDNNANTASNTVSVFVDRTPPTVTATSIVDASTIRLVLSEPVFANNVTPGDFTIAGIAGGNPTVTAVTITNNIDTVTLILSAPISDSDDTILVSYTPGTNRITDAATNQLASFSDRGVINTLDSTMPVVTIATTASDPTNAEPVPFTITFSEAVTGFAASDITVSSGTVQDLSPTPSQSVTLYTFTVASPTDLATLSVNVSADTVHDLNGNPNAASNTVSVSVDRGAPTVTSTSTPDNTTIELVMSEPVFARFAVPPEDFTITGVATGNPDVSSVIIINGTDKVLLRLFTPLTVSDTTPFVSYTQGNNRITDDATNPLASFSNQGVTNTLDSTAPTVTVATTASNPTNLDIIPFTATFSENVSGFDAGDIITSSGTVHNSVSPHTSHLQTIGEDGRGNGQFNRPLGIAINSTGYIYVVDHVNDRVQIFDSSGRYVSQFGERGEGNGQLIFPDGIAIDSDDNIYITDRTNDRVQIFDSDGTYLNQFGVEGSEDGEFNGPTGIAINSTGYIYVADGRNDRIQIFDSDNTYQAQIGGAIDGTDDGEFNYPSGIAINSTGHIFISDRDNDRIQIFDSDNTYQGQFGGVIDGTDDGEFNYPLGITIDLGDNVYVADSFNNRVQIFDSDNTYLGQFGSIIAGSDDGKFNGPADVTLDSDGNIYVTDSNNHRVQKFSPLLLSLYSFEVIDSTDQETLTVSVSADAVSDNSGNANTASNTVSLDIDRIAPTVTAASTTDRSTIQLLLSEPVFANGTITPNDFTITGIAGSNPTVTTVTITNDTSIITLTLSAPITVIDTAPFVSYIQGINRIADAATNPLESFENQDITNTNDVTAPAVTIATDVTSPTNLSTIPFTIQFSEPVTGFTIGDITATSGIEHGLSPPPSQSTTSYTFNVLNPTNGATLSVNVSADTVHDLNGNPNTASNTVSVSIDRTPPTVTSASTSDNTTIELVMSEPIFARFAVPPESFTITGVATGNPDVSNVVVINGTDKVLLRLFTPLTVSDTALFVSYTQGTNRITDDATNPLASFSNQGVTNTLDSTAPTVTVATTASNPTNLDIIPFTATFSENVSGFDAGDIITSSGTVHNSVSPHTSHLQTIGEDGRGNGQFNRPLGIAINSTGYIYVVDHVNDRVQIFDSSGRYVSQFGERGEGNGQLIFPDGIAIDSDDNIYITDRTNDRVQIFDSDGTYLNQFGVAGSGDGEFNGPTDIAINSTGYIYVADGRNDRIQIFDSDNTYQAQIGGAIDGTGNGEFNYPSGIAINSTGHIFISDRDNDRIQIFDSDNTYQGQFGNVTDGTDDGEFNYPLGITIDLGDNVYVADSFNNRVQIFDSDNTYLGQFGSIVAGSEDGKFNGPADVILDSDGNIYITDSYNHRVQKFSPLLLSLYSFEVIGSTDQKTLTVSVSADAVSDNSGNTNTASNTVSLDIDRIAPTVISASIIDRLTIQLVLSEPVFAGNALSPLDFTISGVATSSSNPTVTQVTIVNNTDKVTLGISTFISGSDTVPVISYTQNINYIADAATNQLVSFTNQTVTNTFDPAVPTVTIVTGSPTRTNADLIPFTINFSEPVTGFTAIDITVSTGTVQNIFPTPSLSATSYTFNVAGVADGASLSVSMSANTVQDTDGNANTASNTVSVLVDRTAPTVTTASTITSTTIRLVLSEPIFASNNVTPGDFTITGVTSSNPAVTGVTITNNTDIITLTLSPSISGSDTAPLVSYTPGTNRIADAATNQLASFENQDVTNTIDPTTLTVTVATGTTSPTNADLIPFSARFNKSVTGFDADDIMKSSGTIQNFLYVETPYQRTIGTSGTANGQFDTPRGIAVDSNDNLYVADGANDRIQIFNSAGNFIRTFGSDGPGDNQSNVIVDVTLDSNGNVYVLDAGSDIVRIFNNDGTYQSQFDGSDTSNGKFFTPYAIAVNSTDYIYISDTNGGKIYIFNNDGTYIGGFGESGSGDGQFIIPSAMAIDANDNIYVGDSRNDNVQVFDRNGVYKSGFGKAGTDAGDFNSINGIDFDSAGNVYVTDSFNDRVQIFDSDGTYQGQFGETSAGTNLIINPRDVAVDSNGNIYISDSDNHAVTVFSSSPAYTFEVSGSADQDTLTVSVPADVSQDGDGNTNRASNVISLDIDRVAPTVLSITATTPTSIVLTTSEPVSGTNVAPGDFTITGVTGGNPTVTAVTINDNTDRITLTLSPSISGSDIASLVSYTQGTNRITDAATNQLASFSDQGITNTLDPTTPTVIIATGATNPTNADPVPFTITFSETVTGFTAGDIAASSGTIQNISQTPSLSATSYTFNVAGAVDGATLSVSMPADTVQDTDGNANAASNTVSVSIDRTAPTVTAASVVDPSTIRLVLSEPVFASNDITPSSFTIAGVTGGNPTVTGITINNNTSRVTLTLSAPVSVTDDTPLVSYTPGTNRIADAATNPLASFSNQDVPNTLDTTMPVVTIATTASDPTNLTVIQFTIQFSEQVTGFALNDIRTTSGTTYDLSPAPSQFVTSYTFAITNFADEDTLNVSMPAGTVQDIDGNVNAASNTVSVSVDRTAPTVTAASVVGSSTIRLAMSEPIFVNNIVTPSDFAIAGVVSSNPAVTAVIITNNTDTIILTLSTPISSSDDAPLVSYTQGTNRITDAATNQLESFENQDVTPIVDSTPPTVILSTTASDPTNADPVPFIVRFSQAITGFDAADITHSSGTVQNFDSNHYLTAFRVAPNLRPYNVAINSTGHIYTLAVDIDGTVIDVFDSDDRRVLSEGILKSYGTADDQLRLPRSMFIDSNDDIYIADTFNARIQKFSSSLEYIDQFGTRGTANGEFRTPDSIAINSTGHIYVTDFDRDLVNIFSGSDYSYQGQLGGVGNGTANGQFNGPRGIVIDSDDIVYIADSINDRVSIFDGDGTYQRQIGGVADSTANGEFNAPIGIALDSDNNIYVTELINDRVQVFDSDGTYQRKISGAGSSRILGEFVDPRGIAVASDGDVYVADSLNERIQKLSQTPTRYTFEIEGPTDQETLTVSLAANVANNAATVGNTPSNVISLYIDRTAPTVISAVTTTPTSVVLTISESVSGTRITPGDFVIADVDSAPVVSAVAVSGTTITLILSAPITESDDAPLVSYTPGTRRITDAATNQLASFNNQGITNTIDSTMPVVTITAGVSDPTNADPVPFTISFSESVTGFTATDIAVSDSAPQLVYLQTIGTTGVSGTADGQFNRPRAIMQHSDGNIYVADRTNHRIQIFDGDTGQYVGKFGSAGTGNGQLRLPSDIIQHTNGNIYVTDSNNDRVQVFDGTTHAYISQFGSDGTEDGEFGNPGRIMQHSNGNIYVSDFTAHRVQIFNGTTHAYISQFGSEGSEDGQFDNPSSIKQHSNGNIYIVDGENDRVQIFNGTTHAYISQFGSEGSEDGQFYSPGDILQHSNGDIYVSDGTKDNIQIFDGTTHAYKGQFGSGGSGDGQFDLPIAMIQHTNGNIYVTDFSNHRVQIFTASAGTVQDLSPTPSLSATSYTFNVAGSADGTTLSVSMPAGTVQDADGNANAASNTVSVSIDRTPPTVTAASTITSTTIQLVLSEPVFANNNVTPADFAITGVVSSSPTVIGVAITNNTDTVTLTLSAPVSGTDTALLVSYTPSTNRIADAATNPLASFSNEDVTNTLDTPTPVVTIATDVTNPTNAEPVPFTITFSKAVTGFTATDITASSGTVRDISPPYSQSTTSYTFNVTGSTDGAVLSVSMSAGTVQDTDGNANAASNTVSLSVDRTAPTVTAAYIIAPTTLRLATSEPVFANNDVAPGDFTIAGIAGGNPTVTGITITNNTNTFTLTLSVPIPVSDDTPLVSYIPGTNRIADAAANQLATFENQDVTNIIDATPPTVALSTLVTNPTNIDPISFIVRFSEAVTGFTATDITHSSGTIQNFDSNHYLQSFRENSRTRPFDVAINSTGHIHTLVSDTSVTTINVYDTNYNKFFPYLIRGSLGSADENLNFPQSMIIDSNDDIYIVDTGNDKIKKFSGNGTYLNQFGSNGTGDGQFGEPNSIAINSTGHIYVTDSERHRVHIFDSDYSYQGQIGGVGQGDGEGEFDAPRDIAIDSDDNVYVTDYNNDRVSIFDSDGTYQRQIGSAVNSKAVGEFDGPIGIAIDSDGNVYVSDLVNDRVQIFDSDGTYQRKISGDDSSANLGEFNNPRGIAIDANGDVYVADSRNNRVQKLSPTLPTRYTFDIAGPTDQETLTVSIPADAANNAVTVGNTQSNVISIYVDRTAPTVISAATTSATSVELTVSEPVSGTRIAPGGFVITDVDSTPDVSAVVVSGTTITLILSAPITESDDAPLVSYTQGTNRIIDAARNPLASFNNQAITNTIDSTAPVVTIAAGVSDPTNADPVPFTITFSEAVTGFDTGDIAVSSGTVQDISPTPSLSATSYTFNVAGAVDGNVLDVRMSANTVQDTGNNANAASNTVSVSIDRIPPTVTAASLIDASTIRLATSEPVFANNDITPGDFTIAGVTGGNPTVTAVTVTNNTSMIALTLSAPVSDSDDAILVSYTSSTNRIADAATNQLASFSDLDVPNTLDPTTLTVTIVTGATNPTNAEPVPFTITFSKAVTGFTATDITASSGTVRDISPTPSLSATSYTFNVAGADDGAVLSVSMSAGTVQDTGNNANTASNTVFVSVDRTAPTVTAASVIDASTIRLVLSEPVSANGVVTPTDFAITGVVSSSPAVTQVTVTANTNIITLTISPSISGTDTAPLVSYTPGTNRIADAATNQLASFSDLDVPNTLDPTTLTVTIVTGATNPTNAEPVPFTITFSKAVTGFTATDITASSGTVRDISPTPSLSATSYTFNVAGADDGAVLSVSMSAGTVQDTGNNANTASNTVFVSVDRTAPTVTAASVIDASTIRLVLSEPVSANGVVTPTDFAITGVVSSSPAVTQVTVTANTNIITLTISPSISGTDTAPLVSYTPGTNRIADAATNQLASFSDLDVPNTLDPTTLTVTIATDATNPTNAEPVPFTISFSKAVTGFTATDITASSGTVQDISPTPSLSTTSYTFNVAGADDGAVLSVSMSAGTVQDTDNNANTASNTVFVSVDRTAPTVTAASVIDASTIRLVLSEPVSANGVVTPTDFAITGVVSSSPAVTQVTITANTNIITLTISPSISGTDTAPLVSYTPGTNRIADAATNQLASFSDLDVPNTLDPTTPTVTIVTGSPNPTNADSIPFTISFSKAVTGFTATDITASSGTVQDISPTPSLSTTSYTFNVAGADDGAVLSVSMSAGTVQDTDNNANTASNTVFVSVDRTAPTVTAASVIDTSTIRLVLSEPVSANGVITPTDFAITGVVSSNPAVTQVTVTANTNIITLTISPSISSTDTAPLVSYTPGTNRIADAATNQLALFENQDVTPIVDSTSPTVTFSTTASDPTNVEPVPFTITFSKAVTGFDTTDITASSGTVQDLSPPYSQSTTSYTFNVAGADDGAVLSVSMPAGTVQDTEGNANAASNTVSVSVDRTAPTVTAAYIIAPTTLRLATSEPVFANNDVAPGDFTIAGIAGGNPTVTGITITNNTNTFTLTLSVPIPVSDDTPLVSYIPGTNRIADAAANQLATFSNQDVTDIIDTTPPTVALSTLVTNPTNIDPISFIVRFSEAVTGFTATDITHSSGTIQNFDSNHYLQSFRENSRTRPFDVAINSTGHIHTLVSDTSVTTINVYDTNYNKFFPYLIRGSLGSADENLNFPQSMIIDSNDDIYIVDTGNDKIKKFSGNGTYLNQFGSNGTGDGQFGEPNSIAINSTGHIYVTDSERHRVHIFDSDYSYQGQIGGVGQGDGEGEFDAPRDIAIDSDDNVYVTDYNNDRVSIFDSDGTYQRQIGSAVNSKAVGEFDGPIGIAIDSDGNVYVSDLVNDRVQIFDSDGTYQRKISGDDSSANLGEFNNPRGIAIDANGDVYVADSRNNRVQKLSPTLPTRYTFDIAGPTDQETLTVSIPADAANNAVTVGNTQSNVISIYVDRTAPTVISAATTSATSVELTVSEPVSGTRIAPGGFVITDVDSTPDVSAVVVSGTTITLILSAPITESDDAPLVSYTQGTNRIIDAARNPLASFNNQAITNTIDSTAPVVTIAAGVSDPTNADPVPFTITFSEAVTGFDTGDIAVSSGTVQDISPTPSLSATSYTFNVAGAVDGNVLDVRMSANTVQDTGNNANAASNTVSVSIDRIPPTVTAASLIDASTIRLATSEPVFANNDITLETLQSQVLQAAIQQ